MSGSEELRKADELSRQGRHNEAIAAYRAHMQQRLAVTERPEWEDPHFYLLLIGDSYLHRGEPLQALSNYEEAERERVDATLISDRYRAVARWYEERSELREALEVLKKYRDRDSLLFDSMLDRVARALTESEDSQKVAEPAVGEATSVPAPISAATPDAVQTPR
jgi:tetratricopeptide (TPR) repeat protein